jgi:diguanylate cyclase (GGDEF)-like protein
MVALRSADRVNGEAALVETEGDRYRLNSLHGDLSRAVMQELTTAIVVFLGEESPEVLDQAVEERTAEIERIRTELDELTTSGELAEARKLTLVDLLDQASAFVVTETDLFEYYGTAIEVLEAMDQQSAGDADLQAHADLVAVSLGPLFELDLALTASIAASDAEVPDSATGYWDEAPDNLAEGWTNFGPTETDPLPEWYLGGEEFFPEEFDRMASGLVTSGLWSYDQWLGEWSEGDPGDPPMDLDELLTAVDREDSAFESVTSAVTEQRVLQFRLAARSDESAELLFRTGGFAGLGLAALVLLVYSVGSWRSRSRLEQASLTDPLTGAGNRRRLDEDVPKLLANPVYEHHLIAMIDLDRFKMVNDMWGHSAGDAALVAVVTRLTASLQEWAAPGGRASTVVRLGGDEFIVSLHSDKPIDINTIDHKVRTAVEQPLDVGAETDLEIGISLGFATCSGPDGMESSLRAADLAVYQDKAYRFGQQHADLAPAPDPGIAVGAVVVTPDRVDLT